MIPAAQKPASETNRTGHVVLLGDSILDNKAYVGHGPAVIEQLSETLEDGWQATLLAIDGDVTADVKAQLAGLPTSATHLVLSVGGNDALQNLDALATKVDTVAEAFLKLAEMQASFGSDYQRTLDLIVSRHLPTIVCTIYDPYFSDAIQQRLAVAALSAFNDRITRAAFARGLPVIDLRLLFSKAKDYANPIEPAPAGGAKIASEIANIVSEHDFTSGKTIVYAGA